MITFARHHFRYWVSGRQNMQGAFSHGADILVGQARDKKNKQVNRVISDGDKCNKEKENRIMQ